MATPLLNIDHPFHFDARGAAAETDDRDHLRDLIEQLLLTSPGERVNRPDFGCGLLRQVFEPNSPELAAAVQYTVMASLQRWLGDLVEPHAVEVAASDATLAVTVRFAVRRTGERREESFRWGVTS
ncbi:MAG: GPW/gp25 family protein [Polyangiales bacterium]